MSTHKYNKSGAQKGRTNKFNNNKKNRKEDPLFKSTQKDREGELYAEYKGGAKPNDISWYASNPQLLKDAASFSFYNALGTRANLVTPYNFTSAPLMVPGVMSLRIVPCIGVSKDGNSAVNIASNKIYSYVRHANSGSWNYDAPDLMMFLLAMDSVYTMYNYGKRVYGCLTTYSNQNRYMPRALIKAMGFDYDDAIANMATLRYGLNALVKKINQFTVPSIMPYFLRHAWLFSNVYKDEDIDKSQLYVYTPAGYYTFNSTGSIQGGFCEWNYLNNDLTVSTYIQLMNDMIDKLIKSQDSHIICGDIMKAYGSNVVTVSEVSDDYTVTPVYNLEVLTQIQNCRAVGIVAANMDFTQDPDHNIIVYDPKIAVADRGEALVGINALISLPFNSPSPEHVMIATRLTPHTRLVSEGTYQNYAEFDSIGSEWISDIRLYTYRLNSSNELELETITMSQYSDLSDHDVQPGSVLRNIMLVNYFNYHPVQYTYITQDDGGKTVESIHFDIDNFTTFNAQDLSKINETALMSLFGIS